VRQYNEDREITAWFLLDLSPSMEVGTMESVKSSMLVDFVATLARLLTRHGNRVGAIIYNNSVDLTILAQSGRIQVLRLINDLLRQTQAIEGKRSGTITDLTPLLAAGLNSIKRRSLVFVISDFISTPGWEKPLSLLNKRHEVLAVRLWDPKEINLPDIGPIVIEDAETGEHLYVDTHDRNFRKRFREVALKREAALSDAFKRAGVDALSLSTEEDLVGAIVRFATVRQKQRKR